MVGDRVDESLLAGAGVSEEEAAIDCTSREIKMNRYRQNMVETCLCTRINSFLRSRNQAGREIEVEKQVSSHKPQPYAGAFFGRNYKILAG